MRRIAVVLSLTIATLAAAAQAASGEVIIRNALSPCRSHATLSPPMIERGGALEPVELPQRWMNRTTAAPPVGWTAVDYDDATWVRGTAFRVVRGAHVSNLRLREAFTVTDPAAVQGLAATVTYHGGVAVYVNGVEVGRKHLPAGAIGDKTMAASYGPEAFITAEGTYLAPARAYLNGKPSGKPSADAIERMKQRERRLKVDIPSALLRKGANVLAIEIIRAPYDEVFDQIPKQAKGSFPYEFTWDTCRLLDVKLAAATADGLVAAVKRPAAIQVWTSDPMAGDFDMDWANPAEPLRPIRLVGARNGSYSGKIVVGSEKPIRSPVVTVSDLVGSAGQIDASAVRIRYARPWGSETVKDSTYHGQPLPWPISSRVLDMLVDTSPAEVAVRAGQLRKQLGRPHWGTGAVLPVWVTVSIGRDVAAGSYRGEVTVAVEGAAPQSVPLEVVVCDWTLPDTQDYRTWVELMQSPDTLAVEYGVDLWSEAHWALIGESMEYLRAVGSRVLYVPLLAETNLGNAESMVRWVDKGNGRYEYDVSIMERYLDLAAERMGEPKIVVFNVWDVYLIPAKGGMESGGGGGHRRMVTHLESKNAQRASGALVTVVDPATGKTRNVNLAAYADPASARQWGPLLKQLRGSLQRRGLAKSMMLGMLTDARPSKSDVSFFARLAPGVPWVAHGHGGYKVNQKLHGIASVGYQACVWYTQFPDEVKTHGRTWGPEPLGGWKQDQLTVAFERNPGLDAFPMTRWRHFGETNITGGQRGVGRIGADFWPVIKDRRGRRRGTVSHRYPNSLWMNLNIPNALLAPGPDGPVATTRYEAFREGVQECEARIFIERALTDPALKRKLPAALVQRANAMLDERTDFMWKSLSNMQLCGPGWSNAYGWRWTAGVSGHLWYLGSDWQGRSQALYGIAGEIAACLGL